MITEYWHVERDSETLLSTLLPLAGEALHADDQRFNKAFNDKVRLQARLEKTNKGLAYWVFENNLVYEVFKAWLPHVDVDWECPYPKNPGWNADLAIWDGMSAQFVIEAKWWEDNSEAKSRVILDDVKKLRNWDGQLTRRLILAFWFSKGSDSEATEDNRCVIDFCDRYSCRLIWHCTFPTHHHWGGEWLFTTAVIEVL